MTKNRTRLFSAVIALVIAVTLALPASAGGAPGEVDEQYTICTTVAGSFGGDLVHYKFTVSKQENFILNWKSTGDNVFFGLSDGTVGNKNGTPVKIDKVNATNVTSDRGSIDITGNGSVEVNLTYSLAPGEYSLTLPRGGGEFSFTLTGTGTYEPIQVFKPGSVAQNVKAVKVPADNVTTFGSSVSVKWDAVPGATRYGIYYITRHNNDGAFGNWIVKAVDTNSFLTPVEPNNTYYITVLPFTDTPSRQYGGFSAYTLLDVGFGN